MGMYDSFANKDNSVVCQLKVGPCLCHYHVEGDSVGRDFEDGVYVDYDGYVVIKDGFVVSVTKEAPDPLPEGLLVMTKWGDSFDPKTQDLTTYNPMCVGLYKSDVD